MPTVLVLQGPDSGREYPIEQGPLVLEYGCAPQNGGDVEASQHYAEIRPDNGSWVLFDHSGPNGTFINGLRVLGPTPLRHGDRIKLGGSLLFFDRLDPIDRAPGLDSVPNPADLEIQNDSNGLCISPVGNEAASSAPDGDLLALVAEAVNSMESIGVLMDRISDVVFERLGATNLALWLLDPETGVWIPQAARIRDTKGIGRARIDAPRALLERVRESKECVFARRRWKEEGPGGTHDETVSHPSEDRSVLCAPIQSDRSVLGALYLERSGGSPPFGESHRRSVMAAGRMAGLALEHRRLVESTHKTARLAAVGETVAYLSHHIRNILQGMQGGAEVVELGLRRQDMEIARDGWMLVRRNLERTLHLAKNMLTFSKDRQPRIEPTDLNHLVGDVVSLVSRQAAEKAVTIVSKCEACPLIPLDEDGAHQLVHNLVINALEAVPEGTGQIGVRTRYESSRDEIVLTVQDNGPGIATTDFKRIFEAFQSSKGQGGTGLGLAAARKIVQEHHGRIEVESTVGQGTAFHVYLPANPKS